MSDVIEKRLIEALSEDKDFDFAINLQKQEERFEGCVFTVEPIETWFKPGFARFKIADNIAIRFVNTDDKNLMVYIEKIGVGMSVILDTSKIDKELSSEDLLMFTSSMLNVCGKKEYRTELAKVANHLQTILRAQINCTDRFKLPNE